MAASCTSEVAVFVDSNVCTHIAVPVSPDITVGELKRKLMREHYLCFPHLGLVRVTSLKVKKKCHLYHLPNSMIVLNVFQGSIKDWYLHMDVKDVSGNGEKYVKIKKSLYGFPSITGGSHEYSALATSKMPCVAHKSLLDSAQEDYCKASHSASLHRDSGEKIGANTSALRSPNTARKACCFHCNDLVEDALTLEYSTRKREHSRIGDHDQKDMMNACTHSKICDFESLEKLDSAENRLMESHSAENRCLGIEIGLKDSLSGHSFGVERHHIMPTSQNINHFLKLQQKLPEKTCEGEDKSHICQDMLRNGKLKKTSSFKEILVMKDDKCVISDIRKDQKTAGFGDIYWKGERSSTPNSGTYACLSDPISVTDLITRYFPDCEEAVSPAKGGANGPMNPEHILVKDGHIFKEDAYMTINDNINVPPLHPSPKDKYQESGEDGLVEVNSCIHESRALHGSTDLSGTSIFQHHLLTPCHVKSLTKGCENEVSKRLLVAASKLGVSATKQTLGVSVHFSSSRKLFVDDTYHIKNIVYEVDNSDE